jgi:hypothetical protein
MKSPSYRLGNGHWIRNRPTKSDCLQRAVERSTCIVWSVEPVVEFAGDVNLVAI